MGGQQCSAEGNASEDDPDGGFQHTQRRRGNCRSGRVFLFVDEKRLDTDGADDADTVTVSLGSAVAEYIWWLLREHLHETNTESSHQHNLPVKRHPQTVKIRHRQDQNGQVGQDVVDAREDPKCMEVSAVSGLVGVPVEREGLADED